MKWARKLAATVRGPKAGEVAKQWHAAKKDPESPEGMLIHKLEENDFETFLEIEEELDIPGWNEAMVDTLTETYDDDMWEIERVPGVTVITT